MCRCGGPHPSGTEHASLCHTDLPTVTSSAPSPRPRRLSGARLTGPSMGRPWGPAPRGTNARCAAAARRTPRGPASRPVCLGASVRGSPWCPRDPRTPSVPSALTPADSVTQRGAPAGVGFRHCPCRLTVLQAAEVILSVTALWERRDAATVIHFLETSAPSVSFLPHLLPLPAARSMLGRTLPEEPRHPPAVWSLTCMYFLPLPPVLSLPAVVPKCNPSLSGLLLRKHHGPPVLEAKVQSPASQNGSPPPTPAHPRLRPGPSFGSATALPPTHSRRSHHPLASPMSLLLPRATESPGLPRAVSVYTGCWV